MAATDQTSRVDPGSDAPAVADGVDREIITSNPRVSSNLRY